MEQRKADYTRICPKNSPVEPTKRAYVTEAVYRHTQTQLAAHRHEQARTHARSWLSLCAAAKSLKRHRPSQRNEHIRRPYCFENRTQFENLCSMVVRFIHCRVK